MKKKKTTNYHNIFDKGEDDSQQKSSFSIIEVLIITFFAVLLGVLIGYFITKNNRMVLKNSNAAEIITTYNDIIDNYYEEIDEEKLAKEAIKGMVNSLEDPYSNYLDSEVSIVGSNVKDFKKGDLVGFGTLRDCCGKCEYCLKGKENLCRGVSDVFTYGKYWGGYATAMQQPAKFFFKLPTGFKLEKGAPLFCAGITTYYPLEKFLKPDMKVCGVIGCGGLGHMAIQFLHKLGHEVVAFTTSANKKDLLTKLGANKIVISTDEAQMKAAATTIDFMVNTIPSNNTNFNKYITCIKRGGKLIQVGMPAFDDEMRINVNMLVGCEIEILGSCVGPRKPTDKMVDFCNKNDVYPIV